MLQYFEQINHLQNGMFFTAMVCFPNFFACFGTGAFGVVPAGFLKASETAI